MQPSTENGVWHIMPMYREFGSDPTSNIESGKEYILLSQIAYGVTNKFSLQFDAPLVYSDLNLTPGNGAGDDDDFGLGNMTLLAKYRIYQDDPAPTDTTRLSLITGLQIPGTVLMHAMVDSLENVYLNVNQVYMAGLMAAPGRDVPAEESQRGDRGCGVVMLLCLLVSHQAPISGVRRAVPAINDSASRRSTAHV